MDTTPCDAGHPAPPECDHDFGCLKFRPGLPRCLVAEDRGDDGLLKLHGLGSCPYSRRDGDEYFCLCPLRAELYRPMGV